MLIYLLIAWIGVSFLIALAAGKFIVLGGGQNIAQTSFCREKPSSELYNPYSGLPPVEETAIEARAV